ncbi:MAG: SH3 domain-containing protein [Bdellovibrio sp.]|nr:SH3 domain-containing protein [Bdellovibrio sp.]
MQTSFLVIIFILMGAFSNSASAAQKGKIVSEEVEIYTGPDFDAEILGTVRQGETYIVSDKLSGAFYKIKLKSGKIGFIPDYEVNVDGKGRVQPKDFDEVMMGDEIKPNSKKSKKGKAKIEEEDDEDPEAEFDRVYRGITLQLINFHEDTLGGVQIDDLLAVGYKSVGDFSWEVMGAFKAPKYYEEKLKASVNGFNLWADFGISNRMEMTRRTTVRYGAAFFTHASQMRISAPTKKYDMQDISVGILLESAFLLKVYSSAIDVSLKYFFDRNSYGAVGVSLLF